MRRRTLVLVEEAAGHPFRRSLPPHVLAGSDPQLVPRKGAISLKDVREFLMAYCAAFLAVSVFIS